MTSYIETFLSAVESRIPADMSGPRHVILTAPSLDAGLMLGIADGLRQRFASRHPEFRVTIKMAREMVSEWDGHDRDLADANGWTAEGSLTEWRNRIPDADASLLLLLGTDRIPDQGSLADFLSLDTDHLFRDTMQGCFRSWAEQALTSAHLDADDWQPVEEVLSNVNTLPGGGLQTISDWLDTLPLADCDDPKDMQRLLLSNLRRFDIPSLASYADKPHRKRRNLAAYVKEAAPMFIFANLSSAKRTAYGKAVARALELTANGTPPIGMSACGAFASQDEMLHALAGHIDGTDRAAKDRLLDCDFVPVLDDILPHREKKAPRTKPKSLKGMPIDAFLTAIWETMQDAVGGDGSGMPSILAVKADTWRYGGGGTGGSAAEAADEAKEQLERLLGGIDALFTRWFGDEAVAGPFADCRFDLLGDVQCSMTSRTASSLGFSVTVGDVTRRFEWKVEQKEDWPLAVELLESCHECLPQAGTWLPAFRLAFYEELVSSSSEDDTREILLHALNEAGTTGNAFCVNMLARNEEIPDEDVLTGPFADLGRSYAAFVRRCHEDGVIDAVFNDQDAWCDLFKRYKRVCREATEAAVEDSSAIVRMLTRAFLVTPSDDREYWNTGLSSGLATLLHPALIEMFEARTIYLFKCFGAACVKAADATAGGAKFPSGLWQEYRSLAEIHSPIEVLPTGRNDALTVDARGSGLVHKIGRIGSDEARPLSTRLGMDTDDGDDQIKGGTLFAKSNESRMLFHIIRNYYDTHAQAWDGIRLAFFRNSDIQPVISAVDQFLRWLADGKDLERAAGFAGRIAPYRLRLDFLTDLKDEADVSGYIARWDDLWQEQAMTKPDLPYGRTVKTVTHAILPTGGHGKAAARKLESIDFSADIAFFFDIADFGSRSANFFKERIDESIYFRELQFPILEKKDCVQQGATKARTRMVTHRQFELCEAFTNLVAGIAMQAEGTYSLRAKVDFSDWSDLLDEVHRKADWVACVDVNVDRELLTAASKTCDVISFGSGIGRGGEANYTVSTAQTHVVDLERSLKHQIMSLYADRHWPEEECARMAENIRAASSNMTGLSLIRAASHRDNHVHDFIAHTLSHTFLKPPKDALCSVIVSLDDYPSWFAFDDDRTRPDLLWLTVSHPDGSGRPALHARLVECKLARGSDEHLRKAREQVRQGYEKLGTLFVPRSGLIDDFEPSRRFWWMQLHRIIGSAFGTVSRSGKDECRLLLENLAEGNFTIDWGGAVFAFWTDWDKSDDPYPVSRWKIALRDNSSPVDAMVLLFSPASVRALALGIGTPREWDELLAGTDQLGDDLPEFGFSDGTPWSASDDVAEEDGTDDMDEDDEEDGDAAFVGTIGPLVSIDVRDDGQDDTSDLAADEERHDGFPVMPMVAEKHGESYGNGTDEGTGRNEDGTPGSEPDEAVPEAQFDLDNVRIHLGDADRRRIFWEFGHPKMQNRHLLVFGSTGCGKTYALQCILCELARAGIHSLILDNTGSYTPTEIKPGAKAFFPNECQRLMAKHPLPLNPFKAATTRFLDDVITETPSRIAKRVTAIFKKINALGTIQASVLSNAIQQGVEARGDAFTFRELKEILERNIADKKSVTHTTSLLHRIHSFLDNPPFRLDGDIGWNGIYDGKHLNKILQFHSIDSDTSRMIIGFLLWDLYQFAVTNGRERNPRVVVIDEVQNQNLDDDSPIAKFITEGRKFGIALISATQTIAGIGGSNSYETNTMLMSGTQLFFKPSINESDKFGKLLARSDARYSASEWSERLNQLQKGECYFVGQTLNERTGDLTESMVCKIKIASLQDRRF